MMKKFLTSKEAADYLGLPEEELQKILEKDKVPSYKIGGIYTRFKVDDLDFYRRKIPRRAYQGKPRLASDRIKDFFYFNDFYIFLGIVMAAILYFIFK